MNRCYQINLQTGYGGGEVYTRFFSEALRDLGWDNTVFVHPQGQLRRVLSEEGVPTIAARNSAETLPYLREHDALVITHSPDLGPVNEAIRARHRLVSFAHMPLFQRSAAAYQRVDYVFAVSKYVLDTLHQAGIHHCHPEPLYGVADFVRVAGKSHGIVRQSEYDWDKRKFRDRMLGLLDPLARIVRPPKPYRRNPGLTLGIVSRLTPIKQFPRLLSLLAPAIRRHPEITLDIFGSGGYATVRDMRRAIQPIAGQVRFWGHQTQVSEIYRHIDFLLAGLPEKEALGLNLLEAQQCGTPVLAISAPPFTETVVHKETGVLYTDPRLDGGTDFSVQIDTLLQAPRMRVDSSVPHLRQFSRDAFRRRVERAMSGAQYHSQSGVIP